MGQKQLALRYVSKLTKISDSGPSGGNFLVPARKLIRSRLKGRCRKAAPLRIPRPHRQNCLKMLLAAMCVFAGSSQVLIDSQKNQVFLLCLFLHFFRNMVYCFQLFC